jgi:hypothetical protein
LFVAVAEKLVPRSVILAPLAPVVGEKLLMARTDGGIMVKSSEEVAVWLSTCTVIFPVVDPAGTLTVMLVAAADVTVAVVALNFTKLLAGVVEKLVPVSVTTVPVVPEVGENPVRVGSSVTGLDGSSLSLHELHKRKRKRLGIIMWDTFFINNIISSELMIRVM